MKILYICPTSQYYGDGKALLNIVPKLVEMGVQPTFVVPRHGEFSKELEIHGYDCIICNFGAWTTYKGSLSLRIFIGFIYYYIHELPAYLKLKRKIKKLRPDIIHSNSTTTSMGYRLSRELRIPHVWHIREYGMLDHGWNHFPTKKMFERLFSKSLNYSISITKDVYKYNGSPINGIVVYDGVFNANNVPQININKEPYFLYVGRVIESKGIMDLLDAYYIYAKSTNNPYILKIAGEGNMRNSIDLWLKKKEISHLIEILGYRNDVSELMAKAQCLIIPSPNEAFGFITAEAMYYGCLVVGKDTAGTKMQLDNCKKLSGRDLAIRYSTQNELVTAMRDLSSNRQVMHLDLLEEAQRCVTRLYSTEASAKSVYNYYKTLLEL